MPDDSPKTTEAVLVAAVSTASDREAADKVASVDYPSSQLNDSQLSKFTPKLCSKIDLHIFVPMFFLNFLSLMGRTNIGATFIQKLPQDLKMDAMKIFTATVMPLVMLIIFEVPSNLVMRWLEKKFGIPYMRFLSATTACLGLVTLGQAFDQTYHALLATRFVVGIFDAGLIPGCVFILSLYYPSSHLQWRMSMLMVALIISNIVSNILAYGIANIQASNSYHGWRWIFIVEGLFTFAISMACIWSNVGRPEKSTFLTQEEKDIIASTVESRKSNIGLAAELRVFFSNPLNYVWSTLYVFNCVTLYSVAIFAPSFVQAFHPTWKTPQIQAQVVPIFVVDCAVCLFAGWLADRLDQRSILALVGNILTIIGYAILRLPDRLSPNVLTFGLYMVSMGTYVSLPMIWALTQLNLATPFQKAFGAAIVTGIGNVGGFVSAWIFRSSESPHYTTGMTDGLILTCVAAGLTILAWIYMGTHNRRDAGRKPENNDDLKSRVVGQFKP